MNNPIGPVTAPDEGFCHQIPETFASVASSDPSWTEKVCAMAAARDGSLQLGFGLGKYVNRNVMDAYSGVSRGVEQLTVRASRRLFPDHDRTVIGPVSYEVVEPLRIVRFRLDRNENQPIAFDWTFEAAVPPFSEERTFQRASRGGRVGADLVRYHQTGVASGWVQVDGERHEITPDSWVSTRDHSWGVRYDVGQPATDLEPMPDIASIPGMTFAMIWCPLLFERTDRSRYAMHLHLTDMAGHGFSQRMITGGIEHPEGRHEPFVDIRPELRFDPANRRVKGGRIHLTLGDGSSRTLAVEVPTATGFQLGAGLYFGWRGHHHGDWRGDLVIDGERLADCSDPRLARELHQIRDTFVVVHDPVEGATGWGNCQPIWTGGHRDLGLGEEDSFM